MSLTERVEVILVEPAEGGNVGSCARALKNMGFASFNMVDPRYEDRKMARKMAVHAQDVLGSARVFASIEEATKDANWVVATSVRSRTHPERKPPMGPEEFIARLRELPRGSKAALLFGPERTGLTNAQLGKCQDILTIPTSEEFSSMNLAQAVMVIAWEIRKADLQPVVSASRNETVTAGQIDELEPATLVLERMVEEKMERRSVLVSLGGGVVGDTAGFAAATYQRGVDFIQRYIFQDLF